jgi:hypothetical protein
VTGARGRIFVVDGIIAEGDDYQQAKALDRLMLALLPGGEWTVTQFEAIRLAIFRERVRTLLNSALGGSVVVAGPQPFCPPDLFLERPMTRFPTFARWRRALRPAAVAAVALVLALVAAPAFADGGGGGGGGTTTPALKSITFTPASVIGGGGETATVTFASPASQGAVVHLTSSNPAVASFDPNASGEVVVTPGQSSAAFAVITAPVTGATTVTITGTAFGTTTVSAPLTVEPGTPPASDTVHITEFRWDAGIQTIKATDSNPNAILTVFDADGTFTGITLTNQGGGSYQNQHEEVFEPDQPIIVKSNFGGSDTATVTS